MDKETDYSVKLLWTISPLKLNKSETKKSKINFSVISTIDKKRVVESLLFYNSKSNNVIFDSFLIDLPFQILEQIIHFPKTAELNDSISEKLRSIQPLKGTAPTNPSNLSDLKINCEVGPYTFGIITQRDHVICPIRVSSAPFKRYFRLDKVEAKTTRIYADNDWHCDFKLNIHFDNEPTWCFRWICFVPVEYCFLQCYIGVDGQFPLDEHGGDAGGRFYKSYIWLEPETDIIWDNTSIELFDDCLTPGTMSIGIAPYGVGGSYSYNINPDDCEYLSAEVITDKLILNIKPMNDGSGHMYQGVFSEKGHLKIDLRFIADQTDDQEIGEVHFDLPIYPYVKRHMGLCAWFEWLPITSSTAELKCCHPQISSTKQIWNYNPGTTGKIIGPIQYIRGHALNEPSITVDDSSNMNLGFGDITKRRLTITNNSIIPIKKIEIKEIEPELHGCYKVINDNTNPCIYFDININSIIWEFKDISINDDCVNQKLKKNDSINIDFSFQGINDCDYLTKFLITYYFDTPVPSSKQKRFTDFVGPKLIVQEIKPTISANLTPIDISFGETGSVTLQITNNSEDDINRIEIKEVSSELIGCYITIDENNSPNINYNPNLDAIVWTGTLIPGGNVSISYSFKGKNYCDANTHFDITYYYSSPIPTTANQRQTTKAGPVLRVRVIEPTIIYNLLPSDIQKNGSAKLTVSITNQDLVDIIESEVFIDNDDISVVVWIEGHTTQFVNEDDLPLITGASASVEFTLRDNTSDDVDLPISVTPPVKITYKFGNPIPINNNQHSITDLNCPEIKVITPTKPKKPAIGPTYVQDVDNPFEVIVHWDYLQYATKYRLVCEEKNLDNEYGESPRFDSFELESGKKYCFHYFAGNAAGWSDSSDKTCITVDSSGFVKTTTGEEVEGATLKFYEI